MAVIYQQGESFADLQKKYSPESQEDDVGFFESALAGVATGLWNIPKGFVSLGAELFDLVGDTDTARDVEQWFDDVNPFDDEAEARTVGKITQALTQIAPLAVSGFALGARAGGRLATGLNKRAALLEAKKLGFKEGEKLSRDLARKAILAKRAGKSFNLTNVGRKIMGKTTGGVIGGGIGEAIVADEDIGTLADIAKGTSLEPYAITMMDKSTDKEGRDEAFRRLKNRLKFGTEGALFNLGIIGAGKGIQKIRKVNPDGINEYAPGFVERAVQKIRLNLSPQGPGSRFTLETLKGSDDTIKAIEFSALESAKELDRLSKDMIDPINNFLQKQSVDKKFSPVTQEKVLERIQDILEGKVNPKFIGPLPKNKKDLLLRADRAEQALAKIKINKGHQQLLSKAPEIKNQIETIDQALKEIAASSVDDQGKLLNQAAKSNFLKRRAQLVNQLKQIDQNLKGSARVKRNIFKRDDYQVNDSLKRLTTLMKDSGIDTKTIKQLEDSVINMRLGMDNLSSILMQGGKLTDDQYKTFSNEVGGYINYRFKAFDKLPLFDKYKVTSETRKKAFDLLKADRLRSYALDEKNYFTSGPNKGKLIPATEQQLKNTKYSDEKIYEEINKFISQQGLDVDDVLAPEFKNGVQAVTEAPATKAEIEAVSLSPDILKERIAEPWQREVLGVVKDPTYTFHATTSRQARLAFGLKYMDDLNKQFSSGPNKKIFTYDDMVKEFGPEFEKNLDPNKFKKVEIDTRPELQGMSALEGKYVRAPEYDAMFDVTSNWLNNTQVGLAYRYMLLLPKGASQVAKTILSPFTHVRNFISATAFAAANGAILPNLTDVQTLAPKALGGKGALGDAYKLTAGRVFGTLPKEQAEQFARYQRLGIVGTQVEQGEIARLTRDIAGGASGAKALKKLEKLPSGVKKVFGKLQESYIAEDDFWKITTFELERNRHSSILNQLGINKANYKAVLNGEVEGLEKAGSYFAKKTARKEIVDESFEGFLDEISANMVRNQVPNYEYIGRTAKALRQSPFGNFIAFPLEIMRTGNNIVQQSIDEITSGIPQLRDLGLRRLLSFGTTVGGIPYTLSEVFKAKNNVSDEEMKALRRFVPEWSKNSTLLVTGRDEKGNLKYADFSYSHAYDFLLRPYNSVVNAIAQTDGTNESLKQALGKGLTDGVVELMEPFTSESIFIEGLVDSTIRRGIGKDGKRVWSPADDPLVKIGKGVLHVGETLTPGSIAQLKRIGQAATGKTDKYGNLFNLEDELPGIFGFRSITSDPAKALTFMTTGFVRDLKNADNLFTAPLLRGGRVTREDIINSYKYSQAQRFAILKEMYKNIDAAKTLGVSNSVISRRVKRRGVRKDVFNQLMQGKFTPTRPSDFFIKRLAEINRDLNKLEGTQVRSPYFEALPEINKIILDNRNLSLKDDNVKFFESVEPVAQQETSVQTPPVVTAPINPAITSQVSPQTGSTLPPNFDSLPVAQRAKIIEDFFRT
jgi:hypothetical protein